MGGEAENLKRTSHRVDALDVNHVIFNIQVGRGSILVYLGILYPYMASI